MQPNSYNRSPPDLLGLSSSQTVSVSHRSEHRFHDEIVLVKHQQKEELEHRFAALQTQISSLEQAIVKESKHRETAMQAQQLWFRDRLVSLKSEIELPLQSSIAALRNEILRLEQNLEELHRQHEADRVEFPRLIQQSMLQITSELAALQAAQQQTSTSLQQTISQLERSVELQWRKHAEQQDIERRQVEQQFAQVRSSIDQETERRSSSVSLLQRRIDDELATLQRTVRQQEQVWLVWPIFLCISRSFFRPFVLLQDRVVNDDAITQSIAIYADLLRDGVKLAAQQ